MLDEIDYLNIPYFWHMKNIFVFSYSKNRSISWSILHKPLISEVKLQFLITTRKNESWVNEFGLEIYSRQLFVVSKANLVHLFKEHSWPKSEKSAIYLGYYTPHRRTTHYLPQKQISPLKTFLELCWPKWACWGVKIIIKHDALDLAKYSCPIQNLVF